MGGYAWVTLATNNSYSLGALVLAHSLKKANTAHKLAVLITPAVSETMREQLRTVFDVVKVVDVLDSKDEAHLALMKRPDLGITFTKIHCWRLVEFEKCVFLDADTLVVRNCDELFEREEFSAAPDVSWPDCFNSGVFVYRPSVETFDKLLRFAVENRSFDGGDQGLLNQFFSDWATEDIKKHLPFVYNLTSIAAYSYIPAFKHYGSETRIVHFIGTGKPWLQQLDAGTRTVTPTSGSEHLAPLLQQWWDLFCEKVHPNLDKNLESSNDGMPPSPVEACSNSLAIALTDEPQTSRLTEPCTPYREKDDFRQYNLPYHPFDVKGSSGELLNVEFLLSSVPPEEESSREEPRREEEVTKDPAEAGEAKARHEETERKNEEQHDGRTDGKPEESDGEKKVEEGQQNQQEEPPPPKDPFDYNSFFPDETCVSHYLEQNVVTYQPFESPTRQQDASGERESEQEVPPPSLPRFLTIPENDRRQSGNVEPNTREECRAPEEPPPEAPRQSEPPRRDPTPPREEPAVEKWELAKSKSTSHLPSDSAATETPPRRSIWKSQPNVNVDPNRKYSMPKLKPILPRQNSLSKSVPFAMPKVTLYTEFLMSSEYKDPVDLPKDEVGFVESHIRKEAKLRRCKSDADIRSKFGPLPYALSPEAEKPVIPKKFPLRHLDNELYDLAQCKRQMGNKPKPKENVRPLPTLPPAKDKKSIKKRKSKELSPEEGGREKMMKREPKIVKGRRRELKPTPRNVSTDGNGSNLDEVLQRLREFSKDYQHFFGVTGKDKRKTVLCKNAAVQTSEDGGAHCTASEAYETVRAEVSTRSTESQTAREGNATEFRQFRNYIKDKRETSQRGLLGLQDFLSETLNGQENERNSKQVNRSNGRETLSLQRMAGAIALHSTNSEPQSQSRSREEAETEISNFENVISTVENRDGTQQNLSAAEAQTKIPETNMQTLEDDGSKEHGLSLTEMQPAESEIQMPTLRDCSSMGQSLRFKEICTKETEREMPNAEDCSNTARGLSPAEIQSKDSETNFLPSEDENGTRQSLLPTEMQTAESEVNMPNVELCNSTEESLRLVKDESKEPVLSISSSEDRGIGKESLNSAEVQSGDLKVQNPTAEDCSNAQQGLTSAEVQSKDSEANSSPAEDPDDQKKTLEVPALHLRKNLKSAEVVEFPESHSEQEQSNMYLNRNQVDPSSNAAADRVEPEVTIGEETDSNGPSASGSTPRNDSDDHRHASGVGLEPDKNDLKEHSSKHRCDRPPPEELKQQSPTELKTAANEPQNKSERIRGGSEEVATECLPVTASPVASSPAIVQNGLKSPPLDPVAELRKNKKEKPAKGIKPSEMLCVPDFETPRSSRVAPPTSKAETAERAGDEGDGEAGRSPAGTCRFAGKKKSGRKSCPPPDPSTPVCANPQTGSFEDLKLASGIAGAIAQLSLDAGSQSPESAAASAAHQEYLRRQNWETGNMDYMGRDSFDNIWSKICQTLEAKETEEAAAGSPKEIAEGEKKPEANAPTEESVSLSTILQKCPEYIETLPGDPAAGPVEDDEIIFSKADNRQPCLTNIAEDEEVGSESSEAAGKVKLSDILQPGAAVGGEGIRAGGEAKPVSGTKVEEAKAEPPSGGESKSPQVAAPVAGQGQTPAPPAGDVAQLPTGKKTEPPSQVPEEKSRLTAQPAAPAAPVEEKVQPPATPAGNKDQPVAAPVEAKPADLPQAEKPECKTPEIPPAPTTPQSPSARGRSEPEKKAGECTTVAIPSPPIVFPGTPFAEKDKLGDKGKRPEDRPEVVSEPIPLPPPESPTLAPPQEPTTKASETDSSKDEGKQKKGVFTKILEMVGVAPKEKNGSEAPKSVFYDVESGAEEAKEVEQASEVKVKSEGEVVEVGKSESEKKSIKTEEVSPSRAEEKKSETVEESKAEATPQEGEKKAGQAPMPKPARGSQEGKTSADSIQVSPARKSPSPKLTMPQKPPETAITTPTPPPQPDVPPRKNSGLLKVDETILETPPVKDAAEEAARGKVEDIIGKAKSEVESLLQDRRSAEKEPGESADLINTMKLMVGAEEPPKAAPEEVEELRVTTEEERRRHKGEAVSSKLSDQILKAIPPPRRKAISEASASTSAIPKATSAPEQKTPPGDKSKQGKPSSIPVPPPRSKGKPSPPKGKGKK